MKQILIGLALIPSLVTTTFVQAQTIRLTPADKEQIIKSILKRENFKDSETWAANAENTVYLLADNISPEQLPTITSFKFVLVTQNQVDEMAKAGVEYYRFGDFRVRKTLVRISLVREYINVRGSHSNSSVMEYRCWKASGRWIVKGRLGAVGTGESN